MRIAVAIVALGIAGCASRGVEDGPIMADMRCELYEPQGDPREHVETEATMNRTDEQRTEGALGILHTAVARYVRDRGRLPDSLAAVLELGLPAELPHEAFRPKAWWLVDGWGEAMTLTRLADGYRLRSAGPDRRLNTADDVVTRGPCLGQGTAARVVR